MAAIKLLRSKRYVPLALRTVVLFAVASTAFAQTVTQNLTIGFVTSGAGVSPVGLPISNWATAAIALVVALAGFAVLRRRNVRGGRFFSVLLAAVAATAMLGIVGQGAIREASAQGPVAIIDLSISPTLNVGAYYPNIALTAVVNNTTGQAVQITSITLASGPYLIVAPTTCTIGSALAPGATCSISLAAQLS